MGLERWEVSCHESRTIESRFVAVNPRRKKRKADSLAARHRRRAWKALEEGNPDLAVKEARQAKDLSEGNPVVWSDYGLILFRAGEEKEAELALRNAILLAPSYVDAYVHLAQLLAARGRTRQAAKYQRRAVELKPNVSLYRRLLTQYEAESPSEEEESGESVELNESEDSGEDSAED
jgi:Flp pilus assembly protein TadD